MSFRATQGYTVAVDGTFSGGADVDCFSSDVEARRRRPVIIDLNGVTFMRPQAVVSTIVFMEEMIARKRRLILRFSSWNRGGKGVKSGGMT